VVTTVTPSKVAMVKLRITVCGFIV
jgi:hypothetical protein